MPLTRTVPKPMVQIAGRPFLEYLVEFLKQNGIERIVMLLGYLPHVITEHFGDGSKFGVDIRYVIGTSEDDTGARIRDAAHMLDNTFLLLYCDNYAPIHLAELVRLHQEKGVLATVTVYNNKDSFTKNNMLVDEQGFVARYDRTRKDEGLNGVDIGFFVCDKHITKFFPEQGNFSFESIILPTLIAQKQLAAWRTDTRYHSIGSIERLPATEAFFRN